MKFAHVTISVKDLDESLAFYQDIIGLPVKRRFSSGDSEIVFLGEGETEIELIGHPGPSDLHFGQSISLGFETASLQDVLALLKEKGIQAGEIIKPNPHVMFFFVSDPNGVRIQFVENAKG